MRTQIAVAVFLIGLLSSETIGAVSSIASSQGPLVAVSELVDRFLAPNDEPLTSYRAFRRLTASTRGGGCSPRSRWTTLDPVHGFSFEIESIPRFARGEHLPAPTIFHSVTGKN